jgi:glycosyltransferase involved in cell wall biosynthesis
MKIFTHNFNPESDSGPNKFTRTLFSKMLGSKKISITNQAESDVEFCLIQQQTQKIKPMVLRLDGIYFNSEQDFKNQNAPIRLAYDNADAVVFQSNFNKKLTESWFYSHENSHVIHNAADPKVIHHPLILDTFNKLNWPWDKEKEVWCSAASWRPHKRLLSNILYFLDHAPKDALFAIAGSLSMDEVKTYLNMSNRIHYLGKLKYEQLICLYHRSSTLVHLAYLDHCPNVVIDAQEAGCKVICSSTGGTKEIVNNGIMILEDEWDLKPCKLYKPPVMDFSKLKEINSYLNIKTEKSPSSFENCVDSYYNVFKEVLV